MRSAGPEAEFIISDFRADVGRVLSSLDVFVLPSTEPDPFPTVILEAMAAGKPVVAAAHGGPTEMVIDGETGLLFEPRSPQALASAILRITAVPEGIRSMGEAGRRRVSQVFKVSRFVRDFESLYRELARSSVAQGSESEQALAAGGK